MNEYQYLCPNCLEQRGKNEVLFRRNRIRPVPDLARCRLQRYLQSEENLQKTSWALADWRQYPAGNRMLENGRLVSLKDYDGEILNQRVCPACHCLLPSLATPFSCLLSWKNRGPEYKRCLTLLHLAAQSQGWTSGGEGPAAETFLKYESIVSESGAVLYFPIGLQERKTPRMIHEWVDRWIHRANQAIVWLNLDQIPESIYAVENYAKAICATSFASDRPTVYLLETEDPSLTSADALQEKMEDSGRILLQNIQLVSGEQYRILPWSEAVSKASARQAVEWLAGNSAEKQVN